MKRLLRHPITSIREPFGTAGLIIACVALVAALGGTAFAAAKLNSTQKKEVEKIAKKYAGKPGAPGAAGTAGTNGTNGKDGAPGAQGIQGVAGTDGTNGSNASFEYLFNSATTGDPTAGKLGLGNAAPGSATSLRISETNNESATNIAAAISKWTSGPGASGTLMVRKVSTQSTYAEYAIKAKKDEGAFDSFEVKFLAGNGTFAEGDPVTIQYFASASNTLPAGATETGTWAFGGVHGPSIEVPVSFTVPLASSLTSEGCYIQTSAGPIHGPCQIHYVKSSLNEWVFSKEEFEYVEFPSTACTGTVEEPTAAPGNVCFYEGVLSSVELLSFGTALAATPAGIPGEFSRTGGDFTFGSVGEVSGSGSGSWAVTG